MKLFISTTLFMTLFSVMVVTGSGQSTGACTKSKKCTRCEARDCDTDDQCGKSLICAAAHKEQLESIGADPIKANCGPTVGEPEWELCFKPRQLLKKCTTANPCAECEARDCDNDDHCGKGLYCAMTHQDGLTKHGLDKRKAYCDLNIGFFNWELCFDPKKINK